MEMVIWAGATPRINQHKPCESHVNNEMKFQYYWAYNADASCLLLRSLLQCGKELWTILIAILLLKQELHLGNHG